MYTCTQTFLRTSTKSYIQYIESIEFSLNSYTLLPSKKIFADINWFSSIKNWFSFIKDKSSSSFTETVQSIQGILQ